MSDPVDIGFDGPTGGEGYLELRHRGLALHRVQLEEQCGFVCGRQALVDVALDLLV